MEYNVIKYILFWLKQTSIILFWVQVKDICVHMFWPFIWMGLGLHYITTTHVINYSWRKWNRVSLVGLRCQNVEKWYMGKLKKATWLISVNLLYETTKRLNQFVLVVDTRKRSLKKQFSLFIIKEIVVK